MRNELLNELELEDLQGDQRDLAELIGMEAYINLICDWGRDNVYIGKCDRVLKQKRNERIRAEFTGRNIRQLAAKYKLGERSIYNIVAEERERLERAPGEGQLSLFDGG